MFVTFVILMCFICLIVICNFDPVMHMINERCQCFVIEKIRNYFFYVQIQQMIIFLVAQEFVEFIFWKASDIMKIPIENS